MREKNKLGSIFVDITGAIMVMQKSDPRMKDENHQIILVFLFQKIKEKTSSFIWRTYLKFEFSIPVYQMLKKMFWAKINLK